jgi:hypothetical protein
LTTAVCASDANEPVLAKVRANGKSSLDAVFVPDNGSTLNEPYPGEAALEIAEVGAIMISEV